jgi:hypothetical protein
MFKRILPETIIEKASAVHKEIPLGNPKDDDAMFIFNRLLLIRRLRLYLSESAPYLLFFHGKRKHCPLALVRPLLPFLSVLLSRFEKAVYFCF